MTKSTLQKNYFKCSQAFTLIELMIVIAIIAILATIAIPSYTSYTQKAALSELLSASAPYKSDVEICIYNNRDNLTNCNGGSNGIQANKTSTTMKYLKSISTVAGEISVQGKGSLEGYGYTLKPTYSNNTITWATSCTGKESDISIFPAGFCSN
ncbi:prepilin-type N-terminal cleavage/methylation domain-containing protein [Pasteurella atlantica]|uniref:Prepilin-type N-terminal cleavage/methylation domain-containing protein n=2 Tax=Pasteurellaceae TaxID=712 RepID=A0ACC6HME7_9PAST|nr:prepilin-type N-terminal cleavage/methylation domain-containing protein [Pasteurella atlantica]MDP8052025.1 prepilin-type N-terminal cleavage/methylation domain-containing protein [Pasteurella atlantica]MDP8105540.1 prepilin-type N-terminal cleavage/methylation domain-containing protein [Pasteurella atlantica]MDP8148934.1 prepilin-type N-terminal cleavage/methylation domain-containing protein [Pasteurella atlantica]